ncbi:hypothetical protein [Butyrivibrio sp. NC2002]|uniref:hypothetical protein n=1 Tax=Butyrivibrio sp. NC2002 TaxID=1410610 RepID=UPI00068F6FD9|nr:hypothetical protein [Butyrivibrio sp. NC2002]
MALYTPVMTYAEEIGLGEELEETSEEENTSEDEALEGNTDPGDDPSLENDSAPEPDSSPENDPAPEPDPSPENDPAPEPDPSPENDPAPENDPTPESDPSPENDPAPESVPLPENEPLPDNDPASENEPASMDEELSSDIGAAMLTVSAAPLNFEYDGQPHYVVLPTKTIAVDSAEVLVVTASGDEGETYYIEASSFDANDYFVTNVSESNRAIEAEGGFIVYSADMTPVTGDIRVLVNTNITITPKKLVLKSASIAKLYDGTPLVNGDERLEVEEGFIPGEGATYSFTETITEVGVVPNNFDVIPNEGTDLSNYDYIEYKESGTLEVIDRLDSQKYTLTVTGLSGTYKYDGTEHEVSGFIAEGRSNSEFRVNGNGDPAESISFEIGNAAFTVSGISSRGVGKNAGEYEVTTTGSPVVKDSFGNVVTSQFNFEFVSGKLTIEKRNVTLKSASDKKEYDGEALTNDEVTISGDGFAQGEGASFNVTGKQKAVGVSYNYFTYTMNPGTSEENYEISKIPGKLRVTKAENNSSENASSENSSTDSGSDSASSTDNGSDTTSVNTQPAPDTNNVLGANRETGIDSSDKINEDENVLGARRSDTADHTEAGHRLYIIVLSVIMGIIIINKKEKRDIR